MSTRNWSHIAPQFSDDLLFSSILVHQKCSKPQFGERKVRSLGQPPSPPRKSWGMALGQFPRNPRRRRQGLRWALEHQAMTRKHLLSWHPNTDTTTEKCESIDRVKSQTGKTGKLDRSGRSAMEHHGGHAIDSGQSL